jgi:zinc transporter ZupT
MLDVVLLLLAASGTALATGLGAMPVFYLGDRAAQLTPLLLGFAAGVMGVASIAGLLIPAGEEGSADPGARTSALAIAIQNIPEGTSVAIPMAAQSVPVLAITSAARTSAWPAARTARGRG